MINLLVKPIREAMETLPYVQRYGGLAIPVSRKYKSGQTEDGTPTLVDKTYPIAEDVYGKDCWEQDRYQDLTPSSRYASVFWLEETNPVQIAPVTTQSRAYRFKGGEAKQVTASVRLIAFMDRSKLRYDAGYIPGDLLVRLDLRDKEITEGDVPIGNISIKPTGFEQKGPGIFSRYSFDNMENYLLFPYDYFALNLQITGRISGSCISLTQINPTVC